MRRCLIGGALAISALLGGDRAQAQSYPDFTLVRGRPSPFSSVLQFRAGVLGDIASPEDESIGLESKIGWDGHVYYRAEDFGGRQAVVDVYAGRDGAYLGLLEGDLLGQETQSRLELFARYFPFYREGFYSGDDFVPTGRYEGNDYGGALSVARELQDGLRLEMSAFYRRMTFQANAETEPNYVIPDDYNTYGARATLEHVTLTLDRMTGRPQAGFLLTLAGERELNDSDRTFGVTGIYESQLPSGLWRGFGRLEWYVPQAENIVWEVIADGAITDKKDRVFDNDAQKPIGFAWIDGEIRLRWEFGRSFWITPFGKAQYLRTLAQNGVSSSQEVFLGGGLDMGLEIGEGIFVITEYSYLSNESRGPVSTSVDTFGQHRFFAGIEVQFGAQRK